jgi:tungstate transport system ATP-binding protein
MLFEVKGLTKVYSGRTVLSIDELSIEKGKIYGLLGPNGAGKTTLLEILSFLQPPTTGQVIYNSATVDYSQPSLVRLRRQVVLMPQTPILFTTTVFKNVEFGLKIRRVPKKERLSIVSEALELVGMKEFSDRPAHRLSGGETQRVAIARALACRPEVFFFDEPTASVDLEHQIAIETIIKDINAQKGLSIVLTTHNLLQASRIAPEQIFLYNGYLASSMYENSFAGEIVVDPDGRQFCLVNNGLRFPLSTHKTGQVKVSIDPKSIELDFNHGPGKAEQGITGRIVQLTEEGRDVRVVVDVGLMLNVVTQAGHLAAARPGLGAEVLVLVPGKAVTVR